VNAVTLWEGRRGGSVSLHVTGGLIPRLSTLTKVRMDTATTAPQSSAPTVVYCIYNQLASGG